MRASSVLFPMAVGLSVVLGSLTFAPAAHAETIQIFFTGLDFELITDPTDNSIKSIFDVKESNTTRANGDEDKADSLDSVEFKEDGNLVKRDTASVFADLYIKDASAIDKDFGHDTTGGNGDVFGFDLFGVADGQRTWWVELNLETLDVFHVGSGFAISALGKVSSIAGQDLPSPLKDIDPNEDVTIAVSSSRLSGLQNDGTYLTALTASGIGDISATLVPEPSTLVGLLMAGIALAASAWMRWRR